MKEIFLTRGFKAKVSDCDFERIAQFRWCVKSAKEKAYAVSRLGGGPIVRMHRLILDQVGEAWVDHIDGDGLNNQRSNLRIVSKRQNVMNSGKWSFRNKEQGKRCTSKFKGVCKSNNPKSHPKDRPFMSYITKEYKRVYLGWFSTEEEAAEAYNKAAREAFGDHARLNILGE